MNLEDRSWKIQHVGIITSDEKTSMVKIAKEYSRRWGQENGIKILANDLYIDHPGGYKIVVESDGSLNYKEIMNALAFSTCIKMHTQNVVELFKESLGKEYLTNTFDTIYKKSLNTGAKIKLVGDTIFVVLDKPRNYCDVPPLKNLLYRLNQEDIRIPWLRDLRIKYRIKEGVSLL